MKKLLALSLLLISTGAFAQKVKLALNLKTDSTYYLATNGKLSVIQDIPGHKQTVDVTIAARIAHKVTAIKDTVYEMEVSYDKMSMHLAVGTVVMDMSADDKSSTNPLSKILANVLNTPFSMTISKSGKVLSVTGLEKMYDKMSASFPQASEAQKAQFKNQMQQSFGEKSIRTNFQDAFAMFPKGNVGVNDTWTSSTAMESSGMSANAKTTYTLKQITGDAILVHGDAIISPDPNTGYKQTSGMEMRYTGIKGTTTADIRFNKSTCWVIESKVLKNITGTADIKDSPKMPGGLSFPMTVIGDLTVSGN